MLEKTTYQGSHLASLDGTGGAVERFDRDIANNIARFVGKLENLKEAPSTKRLVVNDSKHTVELPL